ncbi:MAG: hypothetical protein Q9160_008018 [Pyrenula sp. 1 TL-2023]
MVILDKFEAQILIDDIPVEEYTDDQSTSAAATNEVVRYIEAESDVTFAVSFKILPNFIFDCDFVSWRITIDGKPVIEPIDFRSKYDPTLGLREVRRHAECMEKNTGDWKKYAFQFSSLETREMAPRDHEQDLKAKYAGLGAVQLSVRRFGNCRKEPRVVNYSSKLKTIGAVPEKAMKGQAVSHSVKYAARTLIRTI